MGLWDNFKKFAQPYADDEDYDDDYETDEEPEERPARRRNPYSASAGAESGAATAPAGAPATGAASTASASSFRGQVVSMSNKQEVVLFHPAAFNETSKAADDLRNRKAVVVNMEIVDKAMARRVVDFLSGCTYSLDGTVKKIAQSTYLFCPSHMDVVGDLENVPTETESYV